jgi:chromosome segregation ATPase
MAMNTEVKIDDNKYYSGKLDRTTSAPRHNPGTIIKYIAPRVISSNISGCIQGSPHGFAWCNIGSTFPTALTTTASLGLASLVEHSLYTTIPSIHSINGERIIDEHRELSRLTETLGDVILQCCTLEVHNNAQELQIEWLESHRHENGLIISKMYQAEISSAKKIIDEKLEHKPALEKKLNETEKSTSVFDEQYQQLLAKRNAFSRELFDFERQIAQNNAESQFLQRRIHHLDDESKFYLLKNHALHARKVRLRHEYDEEIFSQQSVKLEVEILESEKITCEDTHITSKDDIQKSIDITQVAGMQSPKYYSEQLNNEVQRIRNEYEKKIAIYREELHRKFELELHRYQIQKSRPSAAGTQDYQLKFEQYDHEKKDVSQQVAAIRGRINQITIQIETSERQIIAEKNDQHSTFHSKRHLSTLNQLILDREKQLNEAFRIRNALKYQIDKYKERLHRYSRDKTQVAYSKRATVHETTQSSMSTNSSMFRYSLQDLSNQYNEQRRPLTPCSPPKIIHSPSPPSQQQRPRYSSIVYNTDLW